MRKLIGVYVLFLLSIPLVVMSKNLERTHALHRQATMALNSGQIEQGIALYESIIKKNKDQMEYYWLLNDVLKQTQQHEKRIVLLEKATKIKHANFPEETKEKLGLVYFDAGKYAEAMKVFQGLKQTSDVRQHLANCVTAQELRSKPIECIIQNMGSNINTPFDNIWPSITADNALFSSTVVVGKTSPFSHPHSIQEDICQSSKQDSVWQPTQRLPAPINTNENEGAQHFSADGRYMFFVACHRKDGKGSCDIYYSINNGGIFSAPINAGEPLNTAYWESTPSFSANGKQLYFSSNRKGGEGGKDIWMCDVKIESKGKLTFSNPVNLGDKVNTAKDEISPFIHPDNEHLYFSSNGFAGMGGLDVFVATKDSNSAWANTKNIGYPINTSSDEMGFFVAASGEKAYMASSQYENNKQYNKQIYEISLPQTMQPQKMHVIKGIVLDKKTKQALQSIVEIFDTHTRNTISQTISDSKRGDFTAIIPSKKEVGLGVQKEGYLPYSEKIDTTLSGQAYRTILLQRIEKGTSFVLQNIYFDFDSAELLTDSHAELMRLVHFLQSNTTIKLHVVGHTDNMGSDAYNLALSTQRAKSVLKFLVAQNIDEQRLSYSGKGATEPIEENSTDKGRMKNRRIEFVVQ